MRLLLTIATEDRALPSGVQFAGYLFTLLQGGALVRSENTPDTFAEFGDLAAGEYMAQVQAMASNEQPLGEPVSLAITLSGAQAPGGTYLAPTGISYTVAE